MKTKIILASLIAFAALTLPLSVRADLPGRHPMYLHALSDLRAARWMLEHRSGDYAVNGQEDVATHEIDAAINEIKRAAIDDGKNIHDHPDVQLPYDYPGRLHAADELLYQAHHDLDKQEDDPFTKGLKHRALKHIDAAHNATDRAIEDIQYHHHY